MGDFLHYAYIFRMPTSQYRYLLIRQLDNCLITVYLNIILGNVRHCNFTKIVQGYRYLLIVVEIGALVIFSLFSIFNFTRYI